MQSNTSAPIAPLSVAPIISSKDIADCLNWLADKLRHQPCHKFCGQFTYEDWGKSFYLPLRSARKRNALISILADAGYLTKINSHTLKLNKDRFGDVVNTQFVEVAK